MRAIAWIIFLGFMIQQFTVVVLVSTKPCPGIGVVSHITALESPDLSHSESAIGSEADK